MQQVLVVHVCLVACSNFMGEQALVNLCCVGSTAPLFSDWGSLRKHASMAALGGSQCTIEFVTLRRRSTHCSVIKPGTLLCLKFG
jgi:hypothetical protein